jgi:hypothetical protein
MSLLGILIEVLPVGIPLLEVVIVIKTGGWSSQDVPQRLL